MLSEDDFPMRLEREAGMSDQVPMIAVAFGLYPQINAKKSAERGHDVYDDVVFTRIAVPGDKNQLYFQPTVESHRRRFPGAWQAFQNRSKGGPELDGLPIEQWPAVSRGQALTLKACHIHTVEALANVHDGHIDKMGTGMRELRTKAQVYLANATDSAAAMRLAQQNEGLQKQIAALQAQITALATNNSKMGMEPQMKQTEDRLYNPQPLPAEVAAARRGPGRPRVTSLPQDE